MEKEIPKEDPFDSNSITPGTEFMAKLTNNLKYFIHKKSLKIQVGPILKSF